MEDFEYISPFETLKAVREFMAKLVVGQDDLIEAILLCFVAGGHILIEGLPGLAKTLTAKTFAQIFDLSFKRIQFSPDLLPSDLTGNLIFLQNKGYFVTRKGPIFSNICLLDELNRAPAKVQSALLEGMEERQVTIGRKTHKLPEPFFVLATENPIEEEGTYQLSQAQKDRFLMKMMQDYPTKDEEVKIVEKVITSHFDSYLNLYSKDEIKNEPDQGSTMGISTVLSNDKKALFHKDLLIILRAEASKITTSTEITNYIVSLVDATRPDRGGDANFGKSFKANVNDTSSYIDIGASPRASIALNILSKVLAMFRGRSYVLPEDIKHLALPVLRHRIKLSFEAIADGVKEDDVINSILNTVPHP